MRLIGYKQDSMTGGRVHSIIGPYLQGKTSQVILNMVVTNNVNMNVTWMFSWRMRMRAKSPGLSPRAKCPSQDWLLLHPPGISEARSDLKITPEN